MSKQPWHELPPRIALVLRPALDDVADEVIEAVRAIPAYARPIEGEFGAGLRAGVREALHHLLAEIEHGGPVPRPDVYRVLGRGEMRAGRTLESLLGAYRLGARVAWRKFAALGTAAGLEPQTLYLLAESIFAYIDVLSAESVEGYALEQSALAGEAEMRRRRLVSLLVRRPTPGPEVVAQAAAEAGWALPRTLAAVALRPPDQPAVSADASGPSPGVAGPSPGQAAPSGVLALPPDALSAQLGELRCVILPDPDGPGRGAQLERGVAAAGASAGMGTTVGWSEAAVSFERARAVLELAGGRPGLWRAREHLGSLLLRADPALARELADERLAPLASLGEGARRRLGATLRAWLAHQGRLVAVAAELGVHPQTVRYRLARLRELYGAALEDPEERFWLALALRCAGSDFSDPPRPSERSTVLVAGARARPAAAQAGSATMPGRTGADT